MPTPWPKPPPRMTRRVAASAAAGRPSASRAEQAMSGRNFVIRRYRPMGTGGVAVGGVAWGTTGLASDEGVGHLSARRASDVFVECLEAEGVRYVFGIPGEETLDLNESLA